MLAFTSFRKHLLLQLLLLAIEVIEQVAEDLISIRDHNRLLPEEQHDSVCFGAALDGATGFEPECTCMNLLTLVDLCARRI